MGQFNEKRVAGHDYNAPGTYHLLLNLAEAVGSFGTMRKGVMTLNSFGELLLAILGIAVQIFRCLRIDAMDIGPHCLELVVTITRNRKPLQSRFKIFRDRWKYRRTMTISVFVGYLKMNSSRRINTERGATGEHFWALGFKDRILTDPEEIDTLCALLNARFHRIRYSAEPQEGPAKATSLAALLQASLDGLFGVLYATVPVSSRATDVPVQPCDTLLLGSAVFLNCSLLRPAPEGDATNPSSENSANCVSGARSRIPLLWSVGPGRIVL